MARLRNPLIFLFQAVVIVASLTAALWVRFDFEMHAEQWNFLAAALIVALPVKFFTFLLGGLHKDSWRHAGLRDLERIGIVNTCASVLSWLAITMRVGPSFPRSVHIIDMLVCFLLSAGGRYSIRLHNEILRYRPATGKPILIYGAGLGGRNLLREIITNPSLGFRVLGFIDDNPTLRAMRIMHLRVLGGGRDMARIVDRYRNRGINIQELIIAMPSASGRQMREALANARATGVPCRTIPSIADLLRGKYLSAQLRNISLEDLLGREQIRLEEQRIQESIVGKSILITGGAGSIGSELCRQTACFSPAKLVIFDHAESDLFKIDQELRQKHPDLEIVPLVGDIRDIRRVEQAVRSHSIESIYHAAAYKHVPMMESHVVEAVRNNIVGTLNLVEVAQKHRVRSFVMISSDKAVNPTSVMGVTKRIAELIVASASSTRDNVTNFVSVRFGNVLESNGSVVPTFRSQIAAGGPVTVTHPDIQRYFMSIREAVQLVLQASTMGKGSNIFVLDMGEPVKILDLAHNMIQLAGLVPNEDIEIRITGLRPGEKLFEEVALDGENLVPTYHDKIRIYKGKDVEAEVVANWLSQLQTLIDQGDANEIRRHLVGLVPEYQAQKASKLSMTEVQPISAARASKTIGSKQPAAPTSVAAARKLSVSR
jgi:FlaA1/EpsC-like NDP-sugar epimerase